MEFKHEELVEREKEIGGYLLQDFSMKQISLKTGLSKKHIAAHIRNMMGKLKVDEMAGLKKVLRMADQHL
jgi:DNA-binding NarL/FixJ family response regulator